MMGKYGMGQEPIQGGYVDETGTLPTDQKTGTVQHETPSKFKGTEGEYSGYHTKIDETEQSKPTKEKPLATKTTKTETKETKTNTNDTCEKNVVSVLEWLNDAAERTLTGTITIDTSTTPAGLPPELAEMLDQGDLKISVGMPTYSAGKEVIEIAIEVLKGEAKGQMAKLLTLKQTDYVRKEIAKALCEPVHQADQVLSQWYRLDREDQLSILEGMIGIEQY
ncbi:hypothetical protein [Photobacterium indicum]|uniref:hypothetical protein n=1 Tax=Photobacterium indicum TaxID=81447 RepID=UPI003D11CECF